MFCPPDDETEALLLTWGSGCSLCQGMSCALLLPSHVVHRSLGLLVSVSSSGHGVGVPPQKSESSIHRALAG